MGEEEKEVAVKVKEEQCIFKGKVELCVADREGGIMCC